MSAFAVSEKPRVPTGSAFTQEQLSQTIYNLQERQTQVLWIQKYLKAVKEGAQTRLDSAERKEEWLHLTKMLADVEKAFEARYNQHGKIIQISEKALKEKEEEAQMVPSDEFCVAPTS